jgi:hypothetical protein
MITYIVTFDIKDPKRKEIFIAKLKEEHSWCPIHENAFAIRTEKTAAELRLILAKITIIADRVFVIKTGREAVWINTYSDKNSEWLKKYL